MEKGVKTFKNGVRVINCTPHIIRFRDGEQIIEVEPSGYLINAAVRETVIEQNEKYQIVKTEFVPTEQGEREIREIQEKYGSNIIIIGSSISAQAYPGKVKMLVLEKVRADVKEKIARVDKFSVF